MYYGIYGWNRVLHSLSLQYNNHFHPRRYYLLGQKGLTLMYGKQPSNLISFICAWFESHVTGVCLRLQCQATI